MSRQKGSYGFAKELSRFDLGIKRSEKAGKSKYAPHQGAKEVAKRVKRDTKRGKA